MPDEPARDRRDPTHHKWRLWDDWQRLRQERAAQRAETIIRVIGGAVLVIIVAVGIIVGIALVIKILSRVF